MAELSSAKTTFAQWMHACGLTDERAAKVLGKSPLMIRFLREGKGPKGRSCKPQLDTRMLMRVYAEGWKPKPWPE